MQCEYSISSRGQARSPGQKWVMLNYWLPHYHKNNLWRLTHACLPFKQEGGHYLPCYLQFSTMLKTGASQRPNKVIISPASESSLCFIAQASLGNPSFSITRLHVKQHSKSHPPKSKSVLIKTPGCSHPRLTGGQAWTELPSNSERKHSPVILGFWDYADRLRHK